jgi:hypothetical protein
MPPSSSNSPSPGWADDRPTPDHLVPVVMGGGRPFFPGLSLEDIPLGDPEVCVPSARVTHLRMPVLRPDGS